MTVYLNRTFFKPALMILSVIFGFFFLVFLILTIAAFHIIILLLLLGVTIAYGVLVFLAYLLSKSEKFYLQEQEEGIEIKYPTINFERGLARIPYKALISFEFYPIKSKNAWIHFFTYGVVPDCVYITYIDRYGRQVTELTGYITQSDAEALAQRYNMQFIVH